MSQSRPPSRRNIVLATNSEHGQANIILATAYELALRNEHSIHIISFAELGPRVEDLNRTLQLQHQQRSQTQQQQQQQEDQAASSSSAPQATFHALPGPSMQAGWTRQHGHLPHPPGVLGAMRAYAKFADYVFCWTPAEYMAGYEACVSIVRALRPVAGVCDILCFQARDACEREGVPVVVMNPTFLLLVVAKVQRWGAVVWKFPSIGTAIGYPVPWHLMLLNTFSILWNAKTVLTNPRFTAIERARKAAGITHRFPIFEGWKAEDRLYLSPSLPELEYGLDVVPENVLGCGTMVLPSLPVSDVDPELGVWLEQRPTVLMNLGTHFVSDAGYIANVAAALGDVLDARKDIQVLWKVKYSKEHASMVDELLGPYLADGRVKICNWLKADPVAILETGKVICSVNHGGGNSFYEGLWAGVPQILLPAWFDCYDFATRIEYLGCGIWANRGYAPGVEAKQLVKALQEVLSNGKMKIRAAEVGVLCKNAGGRVFACEQISKFANLRCSEYQESQLEMKEIL